MPVTQCDDLMSMGSDMLANDPEFQSLVRSLLERDAAPREFAEAFASQLSGEQAALVRSEFELLPMWTLKTIAQNWLVASEAGKPFELRSVRPADVLDSARTRRVELLIAMEEERVVLELAHVPGRHGTWYQASSLARTG